MYTITLILFYSPLFNTSFFSLKFLPQIDHTQKKTKEKRIFQPIRGNQSCCCELLNKGDSTVYGLRLLLHCHTFYEDYTNIHFFYLRFVFRDFRDRTGGQGRE